MRKIVLANKKEYQINRCGASDGYLWIGFLDGVMDFVKAGKILSDVEATKKIIDTYDFDGMETVYEGYTELQIIQKEYDGTLLISLKKVS